MRTRIEWLVALAAAVLVGGCITEEPGDNGTDDESNPFLEDQTEADKDDTSYQNPDGLEVEVDLEAEVEADAYRIYDAPADLAQFVLTYLRKHHEFYLESIAEIATSGDRVEWQVDGQWVPAAQARELRPEQLRRFRIRGMNAVLLFEAARGVQEGQVFEAVVPLRPYTVMADAGDKCADPDSHLGLSQSLYWYLWNPDKSGCEVMTQTARLTVARMFRSSEPRYPEYDRLAEDGRITAVVLFGQIGDGEITESDAGMRGFNQMARWLAQAGFEEVQGPPVGRRFRKTVGNVVLEYDLYSPRDFSGLSDYSHFSNFQRAISEHEIVVYDGHSMLGASDFWSRPDYPEFYQVFLYGGCLGYEYYIQPILGGKGGWDNLDILSSVVEVSASANEFAAPFLAKLEYAIQHNYEVSWADMLLAIRRRVGDSTFGVSGASENCFTPSGSRCGSTPPDPEGERRYESTPNASIPDNNATGLSNVIEVPDQLNAASVRIEIELTHTYVGDLTVAVEHGGTRAVIWNRTGGAADDIRQTFPADAFRGAAVAGPWTITVVDNASRDTGTLVRWALVVTPS